MPNTLTGTLIRERRLALGLRQADLAEAADISASYLNLIEHNRRRAGGDILKRLAARLGVEPSSLSEGAGGALLDELRAAAAVARIGAVEHDRIEDFAGRFPGWAAVLAATQQRAAQLERMVATLNDRLAHDPHLSASLHEVLSAVSSVRSTAAILADTDDIEPEWRTRFHRNLHEDSERLAAGAEALVAYLDGSDAQDPQGTASPQEEVEAWLAERGWQVPELEEPKGRAVLFAEVEGLASVAARALGRQFVDQAAQEARALPAARVREAAAAHGLDPARLAQVAGTSVLTAMRRMALVPGLRLGVVICDASGTFLFRKPVEGFSLPRFGAACPLWPLFEALSRPMMPIQRLVQTAERLPMRFQAMAICETRLLAGFSGSVLREAGMLLLPLDTVPPEASIEAVGTSCRICPRLDCAARREPSIVSDRR